MRTDRQPITSAYVVKYVIDFHCVNEMIGKTSETLLSLIYTNIGTRLAQLTYFMLPASNRDAHRCVACEIHTRAHL